jgi:uncharacterized protein (TIGR00304 family)
MRNLLFAIGIMVVMAGVALITIGAAGQGNVSTGGFVLIGPFPIVFGSGGNGSQLALLSVVVGVLLVILIAIWARRLVELKRPS